MPKGRKLIFKGFGETTFPCTICDYCSTSVIGLKLHMSNVHNVEGRLKEIKDQPKCFICSYTSNISGMRKHMLTHN